MSDDPAQASSISSVEIKAKIIRANGDVEDLGIINAEYKNLLKAIYWKLIGHPLSILRIKKLNIRAGE